MTLICPICETTLTLTNRSYICLKNHTFDLSKEGYVNLLHKQSNKEFGDTKEMVLARTHFFRYDHYALLKEKLIEVISSLSIHTLLDSGCGEGYYTNYLQTHLLNCQITAFDISKEAVKYAAKQNKDITYFVGSVHSIPMKSSSMDAIINIFSPICLDEYKRILTQNGYLIVVSSNVQHLYELKEAIYDTVKENSIFPIEDAAFKLVDTIPLDFTMQLDTQEEILALFSMTPYSHKTSITDKEKLNQLNSLKTKASFLIRIYQRSL